MICLKILIDVKTDQKIIVLVCGICFFIFFSHIQQNHILVFSKSETFLSPLLQKFAMFHSSSKTCLSKHNRAGTGFLLFFFLADKFTMKVRANRRGNKNDRWRNRRWVRGGGVHLDMISMFLQIFSLSAFVRDSAWRYCLDFYKISSLPQLIFF